MEKKILVETSAHHIHLTQEALDFLMGEPTDLDAHNKKDLSQPGQYASDIKLDIYGPVDPKTGKQGSVKRMTILGPVRKFNQVEISATEARTLKVAVPVRESGDIEGSAPVTLVNPLNGKTLELDKGMIVAKRHIHMTPEDAEFFGVENGEIVKVAIKGTGREVIFGDTVIRVSPKFSLAMHIDTDESNAASAGGEVYGEIVK